MNIEKAANILINSKRLCQVRNVATDIILSNKSLYIIAKKNKRNENMNKAAISQCFFNPIKTFL